MITRSIANVAGIAIISAVVFGVMDFSSSGHLGDPTLYGSIGALIGGIVAALALIGPYYANRQYSRNEVRSSTLAWSGIGLLAVLIVGLGALATFPWTMTVGAVVAFVVTHFRVVLGNVQPNNRQAATRRTVDMRIVR